MTITCVCRGSINPSNVKVGKTSPLIHSYTAEGHSKAVLSVFATEDLLFSSSKGKVHHKIFYKLTN